MRNSVLQKIIISFGIVITFLLILWLILSICITKGECGYLWKITLSQWVPVFLGFEVAFIFSYYLTNKKHDYENKVKTYENIVIKMQNRLREDVSHLFSINMAINQTKASILLEHYKKEILLYFRCLTNYLDILEKNKDKMGFKIDEELEFVKSHLDEYKFEITENISNWQSIRDKRVYARREMDLIDLKLDEIRFKLFS